MELTTEVLRSFGIGRVFKESEGRINSLDFHRTHDLLVTGGDDDAIRLFDTQRGTSEQSLLSKKYGVRSICFTHDPSSVVYSSTKGSDYAVRYHDLHANRYVRYFCAHSGKVSSVCLSPQNDTFLTAAEDRQVRLWDLRAPHSQAVLHVPGLPTAAFDEQGLVFCVGSELGLLRLYDARDFARGPFATFQVEAERAQGAGFASLRFSLDGRALLAAAEGRAYVLDAFAGTVRCAVDNPAPEGCPPLEAALSADGEFVLAGCADRCLRVWRADDGREVGAWGGHADVPACIRWSPRKMLVASACRALALWVPDATVLGAEAAPAPAARLPSSAAVY